jgi:hypothetical protein
MISAEPEAVGVIDCVRFCPAYVPLAVAPIGPEVFALVHTSTDTSICCTYCPAPAVSVGVAVIEPGAEAAYAHHAQTADSYAVVASELNSVQVRCVPRLSVIVAGVAPQPPPA